MKPKAEMIKNACNLYSKPDVLLDFISDQIVAEIMQNGWRTSQSHMAMLTFIIPEEPPEAATFDLFHNQFICYVASAEDAFVESKLYVCVSKPGSKAVMWKNDRYVTEGIGPNKFASVEVLLRYIRKNRPSREFATYRTKMNPGNLSVEIGGEPAANIMELLLKTYPPEDDAKLKPSCDRFEHCQQLNGYLRLV